MTTFRICWEIKMRLPWASTKRAVALDAHPALCSTSFKVMHWSSANASHFPHMLGAAPISASRIIGPNLQAGIQA